MGSVKCAAMPTSHLFTFALLVVGIFAHPGALECGNDLTSRLRTFPPSMIMGQYTEEAPSNAPVSVSIEGATVSIKAGYGQFFVARAFGSLFRPATLSITSETNTNAPNLVMTSDCTSQLYLNYTDIDSPPAATYTFMQSNATKIVVGYSGGGSVHIVTVHSED